MVAERRSARERAKREARDPGGRARQPDHQSQSRTDLSVPVARGQDDRRLAREDSGGRRPVDGAPFAPAVHRPRAVLGRQIARRGRAGRAAREVLAADGGCGPRRWRQHAGACPVRSVRQQQRRPGLQPAVRGRRKRARLSGGLFWWPKPPVRHLARRDTPAPRGPGAARPRRPDPDPARVVSRRTTGRLLALDRSVVRQGVRGRFVAHGPGRHTPAAADPSTRGC